MTPVYKLTAVLCTHLCKCAKTKKALYTNCTYCTYRLQISLRVLLKAADIQMLKNAFPFRHKLHCGFRKQGLLRRMLLLDYMYFFFIILVKYQDWQKVSHDRHSTTLTILKCLININHKTITILLQMLRVGCRSPFMGLPIQFTLQGKVKTVLVGHINTPFNIINK